MATMNLWPPCNLVEEKIMCKYKESRTTFDFLLYYHPNFPAKRMKLCLSNLFYLKEWFSGSALILFRGQLFAILINPFQVSGPWNPEGKMLEQGPHHTAFLSCLKKKNNQTFKEGEWSSWLLDHCLASVPDLLPPEWYRQTGDTQGNTGMRLQPYSRLSWHS